MTRIWLPLTSVLLLSICAANAQGTTSSQKFQFREPSIKSYIVETNTVSAKPGAAQSLMAHREGDPANRVEIKSRVVVKLKPGTEISRALAGSSLKLSRVISPDTFILQATDAWTAMNESERLATLPDVVVSSPVMRRSLGLHGGYAFKPNDPFFTNQWSLEQRDSNSIAIGVDLNVRAAWPQTRGEGVVIGIADNGIELNHPDLASRAAETLHYNFISGTTNGMPASPSETHATAVAGLAIAELNNEMGGAGVAPGATFASWKIFNGNTLAVDDEQLMDMFQYASNSVAVQNHSWGYIGLGQEGFSMAEDNGIENAIKFGRGGLGVVMVRAAGNRRTDGYQGVIYGPQNANANDDGYNADPRVIVAAGARSDGRVTRYSNPGACILVGAPVSESRTNDTGSINTNFPALFTTGREGGYTNFLGTSGAAPQIAGLAALIISANTNLCYRDVQQILIHSARHIDLTDPGIATNGAGFRVSHNVGFGIPDAAMAVNLAKNWINRPALTSLTLQNTDFKTIPDQGFRARATGEGVPTTLTNIVALMPNEERHPDIAPGEMFRPDSPTASLPLVYVGTASSAITEDLTGKGALIQRGGGVNFLTKITRAEDAGAAFAIIYNNTGDDSLLLMGGLTNFLKIPSTFIGYSDGNALVSQSQTNSNLRAQLRLDTASYLFTVTNQLLLEHVAVKVRTDNLRRADIRLTLTSPQGTRSILQRVNKDPGTNQPIDWTYLSTHHFYESGVGTWTVAFSDEVAGAIGVVQEVEVELFGTPIDDSDADGLDDAWENLYFGSLNHGPKEDSDNDGYSNSREQIMGTNPLQMDVPFVLDLSRADESIARISWPGSTNFNYEVRMGTNVANLSVLTNVTGKFPETEWMLPYTNAAQFFRVQSIPHP